ELPIIDYHNHLLQNEIYEDKNYQTIFDIWLAGDHYKWRAMRANGIEEAYITGDKPAFEKFKAYAKTVPNTFGNPLYHWTHLELLRYFDIDEVLNEDSAERIWNQANQKLQSPALSVRNILAKDKVELIGTTDDPTDDLSYHAKLKEEGYETHVVPSFRPDTGLGIEKETFNGWVERLAEVSNISINNYDSFLQALETRVNFFDEMGCRSSDHGINIMFYEKASKEEVTAIFEKRLHNQSLTVKEVNQVKTYTLVK